MSSPPLAFVKLHGIGNDFLFVDGRDLDLDLAGAPGAWLCDRHEGIGADGVLILIGTLASPEMRVVNADGSIAQMCGNGLRCFAKVLGDDYLPGADEVAVITGKGTLGCRLWRGADGRVERVTVDMGEASFDPRVVPLAQHVDVPWIEEAVALEGVDGRQIRVTALNTGNPHGVVFETVDAATRLRVGPALHDNPLFPAKANIEFVDVLVSGADGRPRLAVEVFERGVGWTRACGTGAVAAVLAAVRTGRVAAGQDVEVRLPGGWLQIAVTPQLRATMTGPAVEVFRGEVSLPPLVRI